MGMDGAGLGMTLSALAPLRRQGALPPRQLPLQRSLASGFALASKLEEDSLTLTWIVTTTIRNHQLATLLSTNG